MDRKKLLMIAAGASVLTVLGVLLPWATLSDEGLGGALQAIGQSLTTTGLETGDGKIVLVLALIGAGLTGALFFGRSLPVSNRAATLIATICLGLVGLISLIDVMDISGMVSVGIGLWLCLVGGLAGAAASFLAWKGMAGESVGAAQAPEPQV